MRGPRSHRAARTQDTPERSSRRAERKARKVEANTHGGYAGPSIIEILEEHLEKACVRYLTVLEQTQGDEDEEYTAIEWITVAKDRASKRGTARGVVRGLAEAVALWRNPYTMKESVKGVEREFMRRARARVK